ncbi:MAG: hypothetical protein NTU83_03875 [Candidatus Hydrogenedentes bacterium]|nr:hypothetical protein [Candidatus Hydrogenedentota bacterium]
MEGHDYAIRMKRLLGFLFGGRRDESDGAHQCVSDVQTPHDRPQLYRIDFDMMLKGSVYQRRRGPVRQYGVTVNGSTCLVTSGDLVDEETLYALIAAGAVRAPQSQPLPKPGKPALLDRTAVEGDDY